ncbi:MAG: ABC transporter substrate-binding protein [Peptococcaceae bacterium BICA1-7]|nr:MAG: ABC transporter substrate-binding protein [Peptococcaceae bacterium BICA1-7]HBV97946.1 ABC transporter substrate-binding protein [Desulfotomaculum sp.]
MKRRVAWLLVFFVAAAAAVAGCGSKKEGVPGPEVKERKVTVMLDWTPNTNHTGLYVAKEKGFFSEKGLAVDIVQPSQGGTTELVATGRAQFGVSYQEDVTMARASGVPIVSLAAVVQHNTSGFVSKKQANITSPEDFEGKRYGGWGSASEEAVLKAVMEKAGADPKKTKIINIGTSDFFTAINRDIDFAWIYYAWTGIEAELKGVPLNTIMLKDLDPVLDYYTPVLISSEQTIQSDPQLVRDFLDAVARGYLFAGENPDAAAELLLKQVPELNPELVKSSQRWISPRYKDDAGRWGEQKKEVWVNYAGWMERHSLLPGRVEVEKAFTNDYLPAS